MSSSHSRAWCTSDQKTSQVKKLVTSLVGDYRPYPNSPSTILARKVRILNCLGIERLSREHAARSRRCFHADEMNWTLVDLVVDGQKVLKDNGKPVKVKQAHGKRIVTRWLPIFAWSEEQVWDRIHASGVRYHDAYEKGMSRLSCCFCVLASKADLIIAAQHNKGLAQEYLAVEVKVGKQFVGKPGAAGAFSIADIITAANRAEAAKVSA